MTRHKIKIKAPFAAMGTQVWIDDMKIGGVQNIAFEHPVGEMPTVVLTLSPESLEIHGDVNIEMLTADISALNQLAWAQFFEMSQDGKVFLTGAALRMLLAMVPPSRDLTS